MALYKRVRTTHCRAGHEYTEENTIWIKSPRTWDGKTRNCRKCRQAALQRRPKDKLAEKMRNWREANPERNRKVWQAREQRVKELLLAARQGGCIKCGEIDPACLDFHHRNPAEKDGHIGVFRRFGMKRLQAEIEKCDVLCANCHRKFHRDQREREKDQL